MKPKCIFVLKRFQVLCQKSPVKTRYPELTYKRYCLYPPGCLVQRHLCFIEGVSLPLEARKEFLGEINLLRFHYTWINAINSTEIEALWIKHCAFIDCGLLKNFKYCIYLCGKSKFRNWRKIRSNLLTLCWKVLVVTLKFFFCFDFLPSDSNSALRF